MTRPTDVGQGNAKHCTLVQCFGFGQDHFILVEIARSQAMIIQLLAIADLLFTYFQIDSLIKSLYNSKRVFQQHNLLSSKLIKLEYHFLG